MFWRKLWGTCMSSNGRSRGASVAERSNVVSRKTSVRVIFGVWTSLPHVEIGLDAWGNLYFEASARRSAHAPPFTIKILQLALLRKSGCRLMAGQTSKSSQLCFLRSKLLYRETLLLLLPTLVQLEFFCQSDGMEKGFECCSAAQT